MSIKIPIIILVPSFLFLFIQSQKAMSFIISRESDQYKRIISPPVTPKHDIEACFMKSNTMEQYNAETLPLSPPSYPMTSPLHRRRESSFDSSSSGHSIASLPNKRKQNNPIRSPPSTIDGAFRMPLDILARALNVMPNQQNHPTTTHSATTLSSSSSSTLPKKRKRGIDCITPTIQALEQKENQKEQQEKVEAHNCNRKRNSAFALSSLLLPTPLPSQPESSPSGALPAEPQVEFIKKSGTGAAHIYDNLSADCDQATLFRNSEEWIPSLEVFNRRPTIRVSWKGSK